MRIQELLSTAIITISFLMAEPGFAQSPLGINYQGVARNMDGSPQVSQIISLKIEILDGGPSGVVTYSEIHSVETNAFGLFTVVIGLGSSSGNIEDIQWETGNKWLQIEIDMNGGTDYQLVGAQQIFSVPYAMYASQSGTSVTAGDGISLSDGVVTNTKPDRDMTLLGAGDVTVTGNYPDFVITGLGTLLTLTQVLNEGNDAGGLSIAGLANPVNPQDAATKSYVDSDPDQDPTNEYNAAGSFEADNTIRITDSGGDIDISISTLNADINAGGNKITNLTDPVDGQDAVTKSYLDVKDATDYAFKFPINTTLNGTDGPINLSAFSPEFNEGMTVTNDEMFIVEDGIYMFFLKGSTSVGTPGTDIDLIINGVPYPVDMQNTLFYRDAFIFKLQKDDVIQLNLSNTTNGESLNIKFFGYKI